MLKIGKASNNLKKNVGIKQKANSQMGEVKGKMKTIIY